MANLEGKFNSVDIGKLEDFNNFWCYLPGGLYRSKGYINPRREKIIKDLDQIAERLGIDVTALCNEMREGSEEIKKVINIIRDKNTSKENLREAIKKAEEGEKIKQEVNKKLIPLFEEMVKLGYNPNELMS